MQASPLSNLDQLKLSVYQKMMLASSLEGGGEFNLKKRLFFYFHLSESH